MERESLIKDLQGLLSEDGSALDRMNAGQGGEIYPSWFRSFAKKLKQEGVTEETLEDWVDGNPDKMRQLLIESQNNATSP